MRQWSMKSSYPNIKITLTWLPCPLTPPPDRYELGVLLPISYVSPLSLIHCSSSATPPTLIFACSESSIGPSKSLAYNIRQEEAATDSSASDDGPSHFIFDRITGPVWKKPSLPQCCIACRADTLMRRSHRFHSKS